MKISNSKEILAETTTTREGNILYHMQVMNAYRDTYLFDIDSIKLGN